MTDIKQSLKEFSAQFNADLAQYLPLPTGAEKRVVEAMEYSEHILPVRKYAKRSGIKSILSALSSISGRCFLSDIS